MKNLETNGFKELSMEELKAIEGGSWFGRQLWWMIPVAVAIGSSI
jgi:bacteriocin-like protein